MSDAFADLERRMEWMLGVGAKLEVVEERGLKTDAIRRAEESRDEAARTVERTQEGARDEDGFFRQDAQGRKAEAAFDEAMDRQRAVWLVLEQELDAALAEHGVPSDEVERKREGIRTRLSLE